MSITTWDALRLQMKAQRTDGRDLAHEAWADAEQVRRLHVALGLPPAQGGLAVVRVSAGTYGPFPGSPDEAATAQREREDEAAWWNAVLASPDTYHNED